MRWVPAYDAVPVLTVPLGIVSAVEPLVIHQHVLASVEEHVTAFPALALGVLYGAMYRCPRLKMDYALVEGVERAIIPARAADLDVRATLEQMVTRLNAGGLHMLGWYRARAHDALVMSSAESAMHATLFPEPWAVALLQDTSAPRVPAALVRLTARLKAYAVPFYELLPPQYNSGADALRSVIDWPSYRTTADVVLPSATTTPTPEEPTEARQAPQFAHIERIFDPPPPDPAGRPSVHTPRRRQVPLFSLGPRAIRIALTVFAIALAIVAAWFATH